MRGFMKIEANGGYIKLDSLLKLAGIAMTGGQAKMMIQSGDIYVNGERCLMRGKKMRASDKAQFEDEIVEVI